MTTQYFEGLPKPLMTYKHVIQSLLPLPIGKNKPKAKKGQLPEVTYAVERLSIDLKHLKRYRHVCGFNDNGLIPPTYFAVLSQALQMNMMAVEAFPFPMLGLVHIENSVTQHRPIGENETVALSVSFGKLQPHEKGQQFEFLTTVKVANETVWEGATTYLARGKGSGEKKAKLEKQAKPTPQAGDLHAIWQVAEDIGRRYAMVSGDFNLIHIHKVTAKAFGFPTAIAHGMWSKARCLAELGNLPPAYTATVSFKLPILLPAKVEFIAQTDKIGGTAFTLYDAKSDKPHVVGELTVAAK